MQRTRAKLGHRAEPFKRAYIQVLRADSSLRFGMTNLQGSSRWLGKSGEQECSPYTVRGASQRRESDASGAISASGGAPIRRGQASRYFP